MKHEIMVGYTIRVLDNMMKRNLAASVRQYGLDELTVMHGWIIGFIYDSGKKDVFQKDVEAEFEINRSTGTNILKLMEKKGYIERVSVKKDARLKKLVLTEKGIELHETMRRTIDRLEERTVEGISPEEMTVFMKVAGKLKRNLEIQEMELRRGGKTC